LKMDELQQLQAEFMRLQKTEASHLLSERVCVEILLKLIKSEKIHVYYTTDGREYITPKQLQREIYDEILVNAGRLDIGELQAVLNVSDSVIEANTRELVANERSLFIIGNEVLTDYYLDRIAEEINESLQESGQLLLSSLAGRFALPMDVVINLIRDRLISDDSSNRSKYKKVIAGKLQPPLLYTDAFVSRHTAIIRGLLSAITSPTTIHQMAQKFEYDQSLFHSIVDGLIHSGRVRGSLQGRADNAEFIPEVYINHRVSAIEEFFTRNRYVEYSMLQLYQIQNPKQFLQSRFPDGIVLPRCFVSKTELELLDSAITEAIANNEWLNAQNLLPSPLDGSDIGFMLHECATFDPTNKQQKAIICCDIYVVSVGYLNKLLEAFKGQFEKWARENEASRKELRASGENLRASFGSNLKAESQPDFDDDEDTPRKGGKGKKAAKQRGKKRCWF